MLYLGNFSVKFERKDFQRGQFQCLADALDPEGALCKFERYLKSQKIECLKKAIKIYLEHCLEIKSLPKNVVLINFEETSILNADNFGSIGCAIPGKTKKMDCFSLQSDEETELKPFLVRKNGKWYPYKEEKVSEEKGKGTV